MKMTPYFGLDFFDFLILFVQRMAAFCFFGLSPDELASDEIQLITLALSGISCALLGTFLLLRKAAMLANSLSHTILLGVVLLFICGQLFGAREDVEDFHLRFTGLLIAALFSVMLTTGATLFLQRVIGVQEDASIGITFTFFFSIAILLITLFTKNAHIGSELIMGSADLLTLQDLKLSLLVAGLNGVIVIFFYRLMVLFSFDPLFAGSLGFSRILFDLLFLFQLSITIVAAFRAIGVLMVLGFLTLPYLIARLFFNQLWKILSLALGIAISFSSMGAALARHLLSLYGLPLSTGGIVIVLLFICFLLTLLILFFRRSRSSMTAHHITSPFPPLEEPCMRIDRRETSRALLSNSPYAKSTHRTLHHTDTYTKMCRLEDSALAITIDEQSWYTCQ